MNKKLRKSSLRHVSDKIEKINHKEFKVGVWSLDDSAFKQMKKLTKKTEKTGLEHGGTLCGDRERKKILLRQECIGTECEVTLHSKTSCKEKERYIGTFHTHPKTIIPTLSLADIKLSEDGFFSCLGTSSNSNNKITCHTNKSNSYEYWSEKEKESSRFNEAVKSERELHQKYKEGRLQRKEIRKITELSRELRNYKEYYQNKFLKKVELR